MNRLSHKNRRKAPAKQSKYKATDCIRPTAETCLETVFKDGSSPEPCFVCHAVKARRKAPAKQSKRKPRPKFAKGLHPYVEMLQQIKPPAVPAGGYVTESGVPRLGASKPGDRTADLWVRASYEGSCVRLDMTGWGSIHEASLYLSNATTAALIKQLVDALDAGRERSGL